MPISRRRWTRVGGYALMAIAGIAALAWPSPAVAAATSTTSGILVYIWAAMLVIGGAFSALGAAFDRWIGEYAGLWPLVVTFTIYALAAAAAGRGLSSAAGACLLGSIAALLLARWRDVAQIRREAQRYHGNDGR